MHCKQMNKLVRTWLAAQTAERSGMAQVDPQKRAVSG
jgi:hypothetical protein